MPQPGFAKRCLEEGRCGRYRSYFLEKSYAAGECIRPQGADITHFGIVKKGILKAVSCSRSGAELCSAYFEEGDSFPEFLYLTGKRQYTYALAVEKKATVLWLPIDILEQMLGEDPQLMRELLLYVSQRGLKNQLYLNCMNYLTIRERIAYWLVGIAKIQPEGAIAMPRSQRIFANLLHVSRSSLNQELRAMEREGYFQMEKERLHQVDVARLEELL